MFWGSWGSLGGTLGPSWAQGSPGTLFFLKYRVFYESKFIKTCILLESGDEMTRTSANFPPDPGSRGRPDSDIKLFLVFSFLMKS